MSLFILFCSDIEHDLKCIHEPKTKKKKLSYVKAVRKKGRINSTIQRILPVDHIGSHVKVVRQDISTRQTASMAIQQHRSPVNAQKANHNYSLDILGLSVIAIAQYSSIAKRLDTLENEAGRSISLYFEARPRGVDVHVGRVTISLGSTTTWRDRSVVVSTCWSHALASSGARLLP